jgi:hypothetical protein
LFYNDDSGKESITEKRVTRAFLKYLRQVVCVPSSGYKFLREGSLITKIRGQPLAAAVDKWPLGRDSQGQRLSTAEDQERRRK